MEDILILGAGCAGHTAALYAARANLKPIVIAGKDEGGQLMLTTDVENYPGFPDGVNGPDLIAMMKKQAQKFGAQYKAGDATGFSVKDGHYEIVVGDETIQTKTVIICTGASARMLGIPSEAQFVGKGVHTCATCDGYFYKDKDIFVIGGGDSAAEESGFLTKHAKKVTIVHRRDTMRASKIMQDRVKKNPKIDFLWDTEIVEFKGENMLKSVVLKNTKTGKTEERQIDGIFLSIGHIPNTKIFGDLIKVDDHGFIITDKLTHTNLPGVYAGGDVQDPVFKQAITSAGAGCEAAMEAEKYLEGLE